MKRKTIQSITIGVLCILIVIFLVFKVIIPQRLVAIVLNENGLIYKINLNNFKIFQKEEISALANASGIECSQNKRLYIIGGKYPVTGIDVRTYKIIGHLQDKISHPYPLHWEEFPWYPIENWTITPDGKKIYLRADVGYPELEPMVAIDTTAYKISKQIDGYLLGSKYTPLPVFPSTGKEMYVGRGDRIVTIDLKTDKVIKVFKLPSPYTYVEKFIYLDNKNQKILFGTEYKRDQEDIPCIAWLNLKSGEATKYMDIPSTDGDYIISPNGEQVFINEYTYVSYLPPYKGATTEWEISYTKKLKVVDLITKKLETYSLPPLENYIHLWKKMYVTSNGEKLLIPLDPKLPKGFIPPRGHITGPGKLIVIDTEKKEIIKILDTPEGGFVGLTFTYERPVSVLLIIIVGGAVLIIALATFLFIRTRRKKKAVTG